MDLSHARILITNDDGYNAEGIAVLERIARTLSDDVWVVAPEVEQSGAGHSLTMHEPIRFRQLDDRRFAVAGTPTDSVLMAKMVILRDKAPDLVLSGVNQGMNVAEDITYSGTVSAAMEGTLLEVPSIAFSTRIYRDKPMEWGVVERISPSLIRNIMADSIPPGTLINVNFPGLSADEVKGVRVCPQGRRKIAEKLEKRIDPRGRDYYWMGAPGDEPYDDVPEADYHQLHKGYVTITPISLDLTNYAHMERLSNAVDVTIEEGNVA